MWRNHLKVGLRSLRRDPLFTAIDITSYHIDVTGQMPAIVAVHRRHVRPPFPAWTAIDVDRLIPERGITEIKIVARRPAAPAEAD